MFCSLRNLVKSAALRRSSGSFNLISRILRSSNQISTRAYSNPSSASSSSDVVVQYENIDSVSDEETTFLNTVTAPVDVNAWSDEMDKEGTLDMEYIEKYKEEIQYPPPPKERSGYYEFEGLRIWLPKKMLTPATYRYRLNKDDEETLPDDIRICRFEKFIPS